MKTGLRRHLTPGNAVAMAALLVALGGTAVAQVALPNGAVTTAKLANGSVTTPKIRNAAVKSDKIASGAVNTNKIAVGAVQAEKIANSAVKSGKIQNSAVTSAKVADGSLTSSDFVPGVLGGLSASKVSVVRDVVSLAAGGTAQAGTATCPAGQLAISGGYIATPSTQVHSTGPTSNGQGWSVTATTALGPVPLVTIAVCVAP
jgi:hypothetical protein